jgi:hypothetical protein
MLVVPLIGVPINTSNGKKSNDDKNSSDNDKGKTTISFMMKFETWA